MMPLIEQARELRYQIIKTSYTAKVPHLGSCLSCVDILAALYFEVLNIDPMNPREPCRDRMILSKGHGAPALFQVLAMRGFFPQSELLSYHQDGSLFGEHPPAPKYLPGIEAATGSLGHGLSLGLGMALAGRLQGLNYRVFAVLSDGECNEGSVWEAAMLAAAQKVSHLTVIIDFNRWQATGRSCEVMALDPLADKWSAFGWQVEEVDGHDLSQLVTTLKPLRKPVNRPLAIIAHTIKGKGVSFMEDDNNWHYRTPNEVEFAAACAELGKEIPREIPV